MKDKKWKTNVNGTIVEHGQKGARINNVRKSLK